MIRPPLVPALFMLFLFASRCGLGAALAAAPHHLHQSRSHRATKTPGAPATKPPGPAKHEKLLYNHMPKAGGTFLKKVFPEAVGRSSFILQREWEPLLDANVTAETFTVGSVRNPCDYYVSLWAFGSDGKGSFQGAVKRLSGGRSLYTEKRNTPKDTDEDVASFRRWVRALVAGDGATAGGLETARFALSYGREEYMNDEQVKFRISRPPMDFHKRDRKAVKSAMSHLNLTSMDCWVKTEKMESDSRRCLTMFEQRGNKVSWDKFDASVASMPHNPSMHLPCQSYFDESTEKLVRSLEKPMFDMFGYNQCCGDG